MEEEVKGGGPVKQATEIKTAVDHFDDRIGFGGISFARGPALEVS